MPPASVRFQPEDDRPGSRDTACGDIAASMVRGPQAWSPPVVLLSDDPDWVGAMTNALTHQNIVTVAAGIDTAAGDPRLDGARLLLLKPRSLSGACWAACLRLGHRADRFLVLMHDAPDPSVYALALELGADDCLPASSGVTEVAARLRAMARRSGGDAADPPATAPVYYFRGWRFSPLLAEVRGPAGHSVRLGRNDLQLLTLLVSRPNEILGTNELSADLGSEPDRRVDWRVRMHRLRGRLAAVDPDVAFLRTLRGQGYRFESAVVVAYEPLTRRGALAVGGSGDGG